MNYSSIKKCDVANGTGIRVTLFVSGCRHHCKGCFNPETWDFCAGKPFTKETEEEILSALRPSYVAGITLLGGEPFEPENQPELVQLLRRIREEMPEKTVWAFTGGTLEHDLLRDGSPYRVDITDEFLSLVDVLVDGPFIEAKKNLSLHFRGSENQRLLDLQETLRTGTPVTWVNDRLVMRKQI